METPERKIGYKEKGEHGMELSKQKLKPNDFRLVDCRAVDGGGEKNQ